MTQASVSSMPEMTPPIFRGLRDLIRDQVGVYFSEENAFLLQRRLVPRLASLGIARFEDYFSFLRDPKTPPSVVAEEFQQIFEAIAVHETYLFREGYQLAAFRTEVLPQIQKAHGGSLKSGKLAVWSAGCSTGEEVYTIAFEILESGLFGGWDIRIVGSDLSDRALQTAREGRYGPSSFRKAPIEIPKATIARYFRLVGERYEVVEDVRRLCHFVRHNLNAPSPPLPHEPFDVVFFRNVLIYFDRGVRSQVIERIGRRLRPGGYLFLGHSENLFDVKTTFVPCHLKREIVYQKPV